MKDQITASDYDDTYNLFDDSQRSEIDFIITGNDWTYYDDIMEETHPNVPIFFSSLPSDDDSVMRVVSHKADVINKTGATIFYEDQPIQVSLLKALCKDCKIILFKP